MEDDGHKLEASKEAGGSRHDVWGYLTKSMVRSGGVVPQNLLNRAPHGGD
jgi:hypothetical protein